MTVNDENSVYVGGLPYDCTEDDLRHEFLAFGAVIDVKIINDREVGGRCYGFVTFTNPRSAVQAIEDMNGKKIGGRVVRVNDVRARGARPNFRRESFHRDAWRGNDLERDRDRGRDHLRDRDRYRDRNYSRSRGRDREREFEGVRDYDRERDHDEEGARDLAQDWERDHNIDWEQNRDTGKTKDHDGDREMDNEMHSRQRLQSRELLSNSSDDDNDEAKRQLEIAINRNEELQKKCTLLKEKIEEKELFLSELQRKSQKLEDALVASKKITSQRQLTLFKLYRWNLQKEDITERLKCSEQELQSFYDSLKAEVGLIDENARDGSVY